MPAAKLLIIDDESSIHNVLSAYLKTEGYEFQSAYDGPSGLATARSFKPNIRNESGRSLVGRTGTTALLYIYGYGHRAINLSGRFGR